jgi:hypothetical protein
MVFLGVLFVEQADQMLRSRQFTAWKVVPVLLIAATILTFRTPLALVAFLSLIFSVVMSSTRVVNWGKRIAVGGLAVLLLGVGFGNQLEEKAQGLMDQVRSGDQQTNMEWRSTRENGNALAKYAGKSVFAPLIFTIPFPSTGISVSFERCGTFRIEGGRAARNACPSTGAMAQGIALDAYNVMGEGIRRF